MEERLVIEEAKNGDKEAFDFLYNKYKGIVYNYIFENITNKEDATDLVQDVFAKVYVNLKKYDAELANFCTFVKINAKKIIIDYKKKIKRRNLIFEANSFKFVDIPATDIMELSEVDNYDDVIKKLLNILCENQRIAFTLVIIEKKSYKHAAIIMNKTEVNVRSLVCRARKNLQKEIIRIYPELQTGKSKKYMVKALIMIILGATTVTGLAYATYKIYNEVIVDKIFTLSEMKKELPESYSIISRIEALESINYYLEILGEEKVAEEDIKLVKDYLRSKICWIVDMNEKFIEIDCQNGDLVSYYNLNSLLTKEDINDIYEKLNLPSTYEYFKNEVNGDFEIIDYAQRYNEIYNTFESVSFRINNNKIEAINCNIYEYADSEILIDKQKALEIANENEIAVDEIELTIENVANRELNSDSRVFEYLDLSEIQEKTLRKPNMDIKKVWKIKNKISEKIFIDAVSGEVINNIITTIAEKNS